MTSLPRLLPLVCLPLLLTATACGGSDSSAKSKADYVAASEKICSDTNAALDALPTPSAPSDIKKLFGQTVDRAASATDQLSDLADAQPDKDTLHTIFIDPLDAQVKALKDYEAKVPENPTSEADLPPEPTVTPTPDLEAMKSYGFTACVESASTD
jgi:hypothetical protein